MDSLPSNRAALIAQLRNKICSILAHRGLLFESIKKQTSLLGLTPVFDLVLILVGQH